MSKHVIVLGGGIAGTSCLEALINEYYQSESQYKSITLISASRLLKRVANYSKRGRNLESFDVVDSTVDEYSKAYVPHGLKVDFVVGHVIHLDIHKKTVLVKCETDHELCSKEFSFDILCICIGSSPKVLVIPGHDDPFVRDRTIVIRDLASVERLRSKLSTCRRIVIVGNGGISLELVNAISLCEKIWVIRDEHVGSPFLDSEASTFIINSLSDLKRPQQPRYAALTTCSEYVHGPALGPDWLQQHELSGNSDAQNLRIIRQNIVLKISGNEASDWPLSIELLDNEVIYCDLLVTAIGVAPNTIDTVSGNLEIDDSTGGLIIDEEMRTSAPNIYAAGDVVSCKRWSSSDLWFQMRLWNQARQMGYYCGQCVVSNLDNASPSIYFNFDCFTHCTTFFGKKVILLGLYNAQNCDQSEPNKIEILVRIKTGQDYTKLVLRENKLIGATLVGDSGIEETIENLIHDQIDISHIKDHLLDETVDIEDYFD